MSIRTTAESYIYDDLVLLDRDKKHDEKELRRWAKKIAQSISGLLANGK